jgi:hypothetical protein
MSGNSEMAKCMAKEKQFGIFSDYVLGLMEEFMRVVS